jgi:hypothetical protein
MSWEHCYEYVKIDMLEKIHINFPFTINIHGSACEPGIAHLSCNFYGLTCSPIWSIETKDENVFELEYMLDIYDLLINDIKPYKSDLMWINNVFTPTMRSLFAHSVATGEYVDDKQYLYTEYLIEYFLMFKKLFPDLDNKDNKPLNMTLEIRNLMLSNFHIQKTRELHRMFGIDAVYWMNRIHEEMKCPSKVNNEEELEKAFQAMANIKLQARKLKDSLHLIQKEEMDLLKKKLLKIGMQ